MKVNAVDLVELTLLLFKVPSGPERDALRDYWVAYLSAVNDGHVVPPIALGNLATEKYHRTVELIRDCGIAF